MSSARHDNPCEQSELVCAYALEAVSEPERERVDAHLPVCDTCRAELAMLRRLVEQFAGWPGDVPSPPASLRSRLAAALHAETGVRDALAAQPEPQWHDVAPGISCKLLTRDDASHRVGMLVRLEPGGEYPAHTHAGREELHLLDGELWIDRRKLEPGGYSSAEAGTADRRVWTETGCTCVLITSTSDVLV